MTACLDCGGAECICRSIRPMRAVELLLGAHRDPLRQANQRAALDAAVAAFDYHAARQLQIDTVALSRADCMRIAIKVALDIAGAAGPRCDD